MSADVVINGMKTDSATVYRERGGEWVEEGKYLNADVMEAEGRGIPVMAVFATILEMAKGDENKKWLCRPRIIGSIVDFMLYCYEASHTNEHDNESRD